MTVLHDVSLIVQDGHFVALLGLSGCGKTTRLRIIAGLETQTSGRVLIGRQDLSELPSPARRLAMVFQNYAVFLHPTVRENIGFGLAMQRVPAEWIARPVDLATRLMRIKTLLDQHLTQLSDGQRQRVACRARSRLRRRRR